MPSVAGLPGSDRARDREQELIEQFGAFAPRVLVWLGALPTWTAELGQQLGLAGSRENLTDLMKRLDAEDLIETREILDADGRTTQSFWLRPSLRQDLGRYLQQRHAAGLDRDLNTLAALVGSLDVTSATAGSIGSAQWLRIAQDYRSDPSGLALMGDVDEFVAAGRLGDASTLVAAARGLGELASRTLSDAARRAQWRIDRAARIEHDVQRLRHYCPRPDIETAIRELVESASSPASGEPWALHLLGDGGTGKTMLIRYLATGRFAAAQRIGRPFLVARADFDHLDPSYPEQRPAELLLALAADLVGVTSTRERYRLLRLFQDAASALHEQRSGRRSGAEPDEPDDADLRATVRDFAGFVNGLGSPVLLVLDTCEELEKLYLPRAPAPAIDQTFRLLELLHEIAPKVRVLFAGRRWLVPSAGRSGAAGPLLQPRPYLRVVPVGGFTEAEAQAYIDDRENRELENAYGTSVAPQSPPLRLAQRAGLRQVLLDRSRSSTRADGGAEYSPYELASYCDWAASDPDLDAGELRSAQGDPLVEWRIIGRLGDEQVRAALGVAAEFGRFDLALVTPALTRAGIVAGAAFDGLAAQEWVNVLSVGEDGAPAVIEIDEHLLGRIRKVTARGPEWAPLDRRRLGDDARQVIEGEQQLARLPIETVDAAVRLLPPEQAATLWERIEDRCCEQRGAWGWAARMAERVAAQEARRADESGDADSPTILAAIFATQAAATLHNAPGADPTMAWRNAEAYASRYPVPGPPHLTLRARLGRLATGDLTDTTVLGDGLHWITMDYLETRRVDLLRRETLVGSCVAAIHGCVTRGQELSDDILGMELAGIADFGGSSAAAVTALAFAASRLWAGSREAAEPDWATAAIEAADQAAASEPERDLADWAPPPRLADQCRLVRVIIAWRHGERLDAVPWKQWRDDALRRMDDSDTERLAAATIRFELGHRPIGTEELERVESSQRYIPASAPLPWTHRQIGPLFAELAEAWRVQGDPSRGNALLTERIDFAVAAGDDPGLIEACLLAKLRLCRRERSTEFASVRTLSLEGSPRVRAQAWLVRTLVDGEQPRSPQEAGSWFAWWRCQDTASLAGLGSTAPTPPTEFADIAEFADAAEFYDFFRRTRLIPDATQPSVVLDPEGEFRAISYIGARTSPLRGEHGPEAMAAGEVTALRFPLRGTNQLLDAAWKQRAAEDETGVTRARLLASLTMARQENLREAKAIWADIDPYRQVGQGWQQRKDALEAYLNGRAAPAGLPASPELRLPAVAGTTQPVSASHRLSVAWAVAGVLAAAAAATVGFVLGLTNSVGWSSTAAICGAVAALFGLIRSIPSESLPDRIARARAIEAWQQVDGSVAAAAVPSRGVRDLRGLGLATVGGALIARWPLWTMFRPWAGLWAQTLPANPLPAFDLDGLRLPKRGGRRRLVMLEIRADAANDAHLRWERWLGASLPAERATSLLCYRRAGRRPWMPGPREWRAAAAEQYGSPGRGNKVHPSRDSLRLLHIVGTPVRTGASWYVRVAVADSPGKSATGRVQAGEELLSPGSFPLARMGLAVLQAEPVDGPPRTLADRLDGFIDCARMMMDGGANAVIIVPPLPDDVAREVMKRLWKLAARRRRRLAPTDVLRALALVKRLVAKASPAEPATYHPVLDVIAFLRSERSS